ncbi:MAG: PASTA domain-containing protein [Candidatus Zixiibacteriota bacterium]
MGQMIASNESRKQVFLGQWLPDGSWRRKAVFYLVLPLLILMFLLGIVDQVVMPLVTRQGSDFTLPDFTGQKTIDVDVKLSDLNLSFDIASEEYAPGQEKGVIIRQFPIAGTQVKPGRTVKFVISKGQEMVAVPQVSGKSVRQAILDLETAGLKLGEIAWAFSDTIPEKVVVFSYPAAGTQVSLESSVNLMVNRGRATDIVYMPKIIGLTLTDARKLLEDKGLKIGKTDYRKDDNFLPETVLEQSEVEGAELMIGAEVNIVLSKT